MSKMLHGLTSWMKSMVNPVNHADLKRWAQMEYGNDWVAAYHLMLKYPGKVPNLRGNPIKEVA